MKRMFTTSCAVSALFVVAACQGGAVDPAKLVPDDAKMMAGIDVKGLMSSSVYKENKEQLEQDQEALQMLAAAKDCNLDPEKLNGVTMGIDPGSQNWVSVVSGEGVGKEDNLSCIHGKIKEKSGEDPWKVEDREGKKVLAFTDGDAIGYLVNANTVALVTNGWSAQVKELMDGKGKPAVDNSLKDLYGSADKTKHLWFTGAIPPEAKSGLKGGPGEKIETLSGSLDMTAGLAIKLSAGTGDEANAKALHDEVKKLYDQYKGIAAMVVPQGVIDSVKLSHAGASFVAEATITDADMKALQEKLKAMGAGGGGGLGALMGGGGGPPPGAQVQIGAPPQAAPPPGAAPAAPGAPPAAPGAPPAAPPPGAAPAAPAAPAPAPAGGG